MGRWRTADKQSPCAMAAQSHTGDGYCIVADAQVKHADRTHPGVWEHGERVGGKVWAIE